MQAKGQVKFVSKEKTEFYNVLRKRVDDYFVSAGISKHCNVQMIVKTVVLLSGYIVPFVLLVTMQPVFPVALLHWFVMGLSLAGIGMSVMHDANHGAYSLNPNINYILGHTLNLLGGSVFNWKLQHNILHHTYTNIVPLDDDIADRLVMRFSPHTKVKGYQKLQYIYAFFFYGLLTAYWTLAKDFIQFNNYTKNGVNPNTFKQNIVTLSKIIASKVVYFFVIIFCPFYFFNIPFVEVLTGFFVMHFVAGLILTTVFQLAHTVEGTTHPLPDENGTIENNWAVHQMHTTVNFSRHNKWISWYVGGLNFQVEHHLFPRVCHVHYPAIAPIVKKTAEEFGVPYLENKTLFDALNSHMELLYRLGRLPDVNEAIG